MGLFVDPVVESEPNRVVHAPLVCFRDLLETFEHDTGDTDAELRVRGKHRGLRDGLQLSCHVTHCSTHALDCDLDENCTCAEHVQIPGARMKATLRQLSALKALCAVVEGATG